MITKYIQRALLNKSNEHIVALRELNRGHGTDEPLSANIKVLKESNQLKGMHTVLHDRATTREEFVFYFDRISTLLVERALDLVHHQTAQVETPQVVRYVGFKLTREVNAVVILRSSGTLEVGMRRVILGARIGRAFIQSNQ